jgi:hypothetical protein
MQLDYQSVSDVRKERFKKRGACKEREKGEAPNITDVSRDAQATK